MSFSLEKAIAAWRRPYEVNPAFSAEDIEELEGSLRDRIEALRERGLSEQEVFGRTVKRVGSYGAAEQEYRKVYWGKLKRQRRLGNELIWRVSMLKNYVTVALRTLRKQKGYAFINIVGLAVGLACFILILLFVEHEFSYDRFHEDAGDIYRVVQQRPTTTGFDYWTATSPALASTLVEEFVEVIQATTVGPTYDPLLSYGEQHYQEQGLLADAHFLNIFTFPLTQGDAETALAGPNRIVLTETLARKIFDDQDPMGQTLLYQNKEPYTVTGVMADVPETSHLQFAYILPAQSHEWYRNGVNKVPWYNNGWYTYAVLAQGADAEQVEGLMRAYIDKNLADWHPEDRMTFLFQPLIDIHLHSHHLRVFDFEISGNIQYVYLFLAIGFLILLLACVNYTNLAVARSIKRAREVGLRKVVGAARGQLLGQFLSESVLMTLLALGLGLGLVHLLLPTFGHLVERPITMAYTENGWLLPGLLALVVLVGLLSGSYPAFVMASLRPMQVLTGKRGGRLSRFQVQRLLLVGQYAVSMVLVAGSFVVYEQLQFMRQQDLGYDREHIVTIRANDVALSQNYASIREAWLRDPRVVSVSYSRHLPTRIQNSQSMFGWEGSEGELLPTSTTSVDHDFLDVFGIEIAAGRGFSRAFATDTLGAGIALVSETTVRALGWTPEEALGMPFGYSDGRGTRRIVGVMKDIHFNSIHQSVKPLVLTLDQNPTGYISAKVRPDDLPSTLALFEQTVQQFTEYPFEYQFLDDSFDALYKRDVRLGETFGFFTILALLIASLGLFGLAAYAAEQRIKEIGVRKVLGASVSSIVALLSKDFLKLVGFAFVVAVPLIYIAMQRWLENFVYHIEIGPSVFLITGGLVVIIALLTVSYQSIKAALANPVKSLRYE